MDFNRTDYFGGLVFNFKYFRASSHKLLLIFLLFPAFLKSTEIKPLDLDENQFEYTKTSSVYFLEDKLAKFDFKDLLSDNSSTLFKKSEKANPSFGFTSSVYWFKLKVTAKKSAAFFMEIGYPLLDDLKIYIKSSDALSSYELGDSKTFYERPLEHTNFVIPLKAEKAQILDILIRVKTESSMQLPVRFYNTNSFVKFNSLRQLILGLIFGAFLLLLIYNIFLFSVFKDKSYVLNFLFVVSVLSFYFSLTGLSFQYLWPDYPLWASKAVPVFISFATLFLLLLTANILETEKNSKLINRLILLKVFISFFILILSFVASYSIAIRLVAAYCALSILSILAVSSYLYKKGIEAAKNYIFSFSAILISGFILSMSKFGLLPLGIFADYIFPLGLFLNAVLILFALADRISLISQEKELAKEEASARLVEQVYFLRQINSCTDIIFSSQDLNKACDYACHKLLNMIVAERVTIYLVNDLEHKFEYIAHSGAAPKDGLKEFIDLNYGPLAKVFKSGRKQIYDKKSNQQAFDNLDPDSVKQILPSADIPLLDKKKVRGIISVYLKNSSKHFSPAMINICETIANSLMIVIKNLELLKATSEQARMEQELETVAMVQSAFFPSSEPKCEKFELSTYYTSATECGGDWWEYIEYDDKLILLIGDATGHGTPAALLTAVTSSFHSTVKLLLDEIPDLDIRPSMLLKRLNKVIYSAAKGNFWMTFHISIIDKSKRSILYSHAGHTFPLLFGRDTKGKSVKRSLMGHGDPLGFKPDWEGEDYSTGCQPGDLLIWYTDGLTECVNPEQKQIGKRCILSQVKSAEKSPVTEIREKIIESVFKHAGGEALSDDITLLVGRFPFEKA